MKGVILAGGQGTRISDDFVRPKPMIEIGGRPLLWHIMKIYAAHGVTDFIVCCGERGYMIKEYFANYSMHLSDITIDIGTNSIDVHRSYAEPWRVTLVDTGDEVMTGGRLKRVARYLGDEDFCMTYGDGLGNVDVSALIAFHRAQKGLATVTVVRMPGRFGDLRVEGPRVAAFNKRADGAAWANGGFFVLSPKVLEYIAGDETAWELEPLERLAAEGNLAAYMHEGYWHQMDTQRDKLALEELWQQNDAPWKVWE